MNFFFPSNTCSFQWYFTNDYIRRHYTIVFSPRKKKEFSLFMKCLDIHVFPRCIKCINLHGSFAHVHMHTIMYTPDKRIWASRIRDTNKWYEFAYPEWIWWSAKCTAKQPTHPATRRNTGLRSGTRTRRKILEPVRQHFRSCPGQSRGRINSRREKLSGIRKREQEREQRCKFL